MPQPTLRPLTLVSIPTSRASNGYSISSFSYVLVSVEEILKDRRKEVGLGQLATRERGVVTQLRVPAQFAVRKDKLRVQNTVRSKACPSSCYLNFGPCIIKFNQKL